MCNPAVCVLLFVPFAPFFVCACCAMISGARVCVCVACWRGLVYRGVVQPGRIVVGSDIRFTTCCCTRSGRCNRRQNWLASAPLRRQPQKVVRHCRL